MIYLITLKRAMSNQTIEDVVTIAIHFETVCLSCRYSQILGKYLQRKYGDPYPLTHCTLQIGQLGISIELGKFKEYVYNRTPETRFSYLYSIRKIDAKEIYDRVTVYRDLWQPYRSLLAYSKPNTPLCTDFLNYCLFKIEDIRRELPIEFLERLIRSQRGLLIDHGKVHRS